MRAQLTEAVDGLLAPPAVAKLPAAQRTALVCQQRKLRLLDMQRKLRASLEDTQSRLVQVPEAQYKKVQVRQVPQFA